MTNSLGLELQIWYVNRATPLRFVCIVKINEIYFIKTGNDSLSKNRRHLKGLVNTAINFTTKILYSLSVLEKNATEQTPWHYSAGTNSALRFLNRF